MCLRRFDGGLLSLPTGKMLHIKIEQAFQCIDTQYRSIQTNVL